jgi:hypothetical protein
VSDIQKGRQITLAFEYIQQVFRECQRLIFKVDSQMAPEWTNLYGNRITRDVSASLQYPDDWLVEAIFRVYENKNENELVNKVITITFWGEEVEQPIITAGKIVYTDINILLVVIDGNLDLDEIFRPTLNHLNTLCKYETDR